MIGKELIKMYDSKFDKILKMVYPNWETDDIFKDTEVLQSISVVKDSFQYVKLNNKKVTQKPTRFLTQYLKIKPTTKECELILSNMKYIHAVFKIVSGEDIIKYYKSNSYMNIKELTSSCMADKPDNFFYIYKDNCKMLILLNEQENKIYGRAILWEAKLNSEDILFMDRVHANNICRNMFYNWCKENKYYRRGNTVYDVINYTGETCKTYENMLKVEIDIYKYEKIAFMDTFRFYKKDGIYAPDVLHQLDYTGSGMIICGKCGKKIKAYDYWVRNPEDEYKTEICSDCLKKDKVKINGKLYKKDDERIFYCTHCKTWKLMINRRKWQMCQTCWDEIYVKIGKRTYKKSGKKVYLDEKDNIWKIRVG